MSYKIVWSRKTAGFMVLLFDPATGRIIQSAGFWSASELTAAHRWARAAVACYLGSLPTTLYRCPDRCPLR